MEAGTTGVGGGDNFTPKYLLLEVAIAIFISKHVCYTHWSMPLAFNIRLDTHRAACLTFDIRYNVPQAKASGI